MGAGAARHRVVVIALVGACGGKPSEPTVFADGSGHELPACAPGIGWRAGARACRVDRAFAVGCVRVISDSSAIRAIAWDKCAGPAIEVPIERNARRAKHGAAVALVSLPAAVGTPAWRVAIAKALAGDDRVRCETATPDCPAASPASAWFLDATRPPVADDLDGMFQTTVRWQPGAPALPELEAVVLDPAVHRAPALTSWTGIDASGFALAIVDGAEPLGLLATCAEYELVGNGAAIAAVDRIDRDRRWTWVAVADARGGLGRPRCGEGVVFVPRVIDTEDPTRALELAVRPDTGIFAELDVQTRRAIALADLRGVLVPPRTWPACAEAAPVLTSRPCVAQVDDLAIRPRATETGKLLAWLVGGAVVDRRAPFAAIPASLALAHRLAGREVGCIDARAGCGAADPIVRWMFGRDRARRFDEAGVVAPLWQRGTAPALPPPGVALVPYDPLAPKHDEPIGLVYDLAVAGPIAKRATCGSLEVWTSPRAGAIVDRAKDRWAWSYVDATTGTGSLVTGGRCFGDIAVFDYEGLGVVADTRTGGWMTLAAARIAELAAAPDPAAAFHEELRADE